jgi:hypothetical protein
MAFDRASGTQLEDFFGFPKEDLEALSQIKAALAGDNFQEANDLLHDLVMSLIGTTLSAAEKCCFQRFICARSLMPEGTFKHPVVCSKHFSAFKYVARCTVIQELFPSSTPLLITRTAGGSFALSDNGTQGLPKINNEAKETVKALFKRFLSITTPGKMFYYMTCSAHIIFEISHKMPVDQGIRWEEDGRCLVQGNQRYNIAQLMNAFNLCRTSLEHLYSEITYNDNRFKIGPSDLAFTDQVNAALDTEDDPHCFAGRALPVALKSKLFELWLAQNIDLHNPLNGARLCNPEDTVKVQRTLRIIESYFKDIIGALLLTGGQAPRIGNELLEVLLLDRRKKRGLFFWNKRLALIIRSTKNLKKCGDTFLPHFFPAWLEEHLIRYVLVVRSFERDLLWASERPCGDLRRNLGDQKPDEATRRCRIEGARAKGKTCAQPAGSALDVSAGVVSDEELEFSAAVDVVLESGGDLDFEPENESDTDSESEAESVHLDVDVDLMPAAVQHDASFGESPNISDRLQQKLDRLDLFLFVSPTKFERYSVDDISKIIDRWMKKFFDSEAHMGARSLRQFVAAVKTMYFPFEFWHGPRGHMDTLHQLADHSPETFINNYARDGSTIHTDILDMSRFACDAWHMCIGADCRTVPITIFERRNQEKTERGSIQENESTSPSARVTDRLLGTTPSAFPSVNSTAESRISPFPFRHDSPSIDPLNKSNTESEGRFLSSVPEAAQPLPQPPAAIILPDRSYNIGAFLAELGNLIKTREGDREHCREEAMRGYMDAATCEGDDRRRLMMVVMGARLRVCLSDEDIRRELIEAILKAKCMIGDAVASVIALMADANERGDGGGLHQSQLLAHSFDALQCL